MILLKDYTQTCSIILTFNGTNTTQSLINIVKEERVKKKDVIISFLNQCMRGVGWMSEVSLKFSSYTYIYTFRISGLLRTENDDFIYLLLLKTITTITHLNS